MTPDRRGAIAKVFQRAATLGRKVYGFSTFKGSCALVEKMRVPDEFDRLCCEGDVRWVAIPDAVSLQEQKAILRMNEDDDVRREEYTIDPEAGVTG